MTEKTTHALVVDDDEAMAMLLQEALGDEGYEVSVAYNGHDAARAIGESRPNVVVLDINMPGKDGIETLNDIVNSVGDLPVILHTAYSAYKDNYMTWSAAEYVVKTAANDFKELKDAIARVIA